MKKKLCTILLFFTLITTSVSTVFAEISEKELSYLKELNAQFQQNIDDLSKLDTNENGKWEINIERSFADTTEKADKLLLSVYSVVPFYNRMTITIRGSETNLSLTNVSEYKSSEIIENAKVWNKQIITEEMTDKEKVKYIHDKIIGEVAYDKSAPLETHGPAGAIMEKKAVCDGYSRIFSIMATLEGIPTVHVTSNKMCHAFNLVYIDGKWLLLDTTYNDTAGEGNKWPIKYEYFLIDPDSSSKHEYDDGEYGLSLSDYIEIGNYVYKDQI